MTAPRNRVAREGCDRCPCGCKYWDWDFCIDCGMPIENLLRSPAWVAQNRPNERKDERMVLTPSDNVRDPDPDWGMQPSGLTPGGSCREDRTTDRPAMSTSEVQLRRTFGQEINRLRAELDEAYAVLSDRAEGLEDEVRYLRYTVIPDLEREVQFHEHN